MCKIVSHFFCYKYFILTFFCGIDSDWLLFAGGYRVFTGKVRGIHGREQCGMAECVCGRLCGRLSSHQHAHCCGSLMPLNIFAARSPPPVQLHHLMH